MCRRLREIAIDRDGAAVTAETPEQGKPKGEIRQTEHHWGRHGVTAFPGSSLVAQLDPQIPEAHDHDRQPHPHPHPDAYQPTTVLLHVQAPSSHLPTHKP